MKKLINDYIKVVTYIFLGLTFMISSFYLLINFYHSSELKRTIYMDSADSKLTSYQLSLDKLNSSLNRFNAIENKEYLELNSNLHSCYTILKSDETLLKFKPFEYYNYYDVYTIGSYFQNNLVNMCYLSYLKTNLDKKEYDKISGLVASNMNNLDKQVQYALDELSNNGSYYFTTNVTSSTVRDTLTSDFEIISSSYINFIDTLVEISDYINGGA